MATTLYFRETVSDTHLGTDNVTLAAGAASPWIGRALSTAPGSAGALGMLVSASTVAGATAGIEMGLGTVGGGTPYEWISPPLAADVTIAGTITLNLWANENNMSANVAINAVVEVIRANALGTRNSNTIVQIAKSARVTEVASATPTVVDSFTVTPTSTVVNRGDRIRIRVFGDDAGTMAAAFAFAFYYDSGVGVNGCSSVTFTENFSFDGPLTQANSSSGVGFGLTGTPQLFAQPFTAPGSLLSEVRVWLQKSGTPTDDVVLEIQTDNAGDPSGSVVGTIATVAAASLTTTKTEYTYSCSISLTPSTTYWLVFRRSGSLDSSNFYNAGAAGVTPSGWTAGEQYNGSAWSVVGYAAVRLSFPGTTLYLTDTASDVATASVDKEAWTSRGAGVVTSQSLGSATWTAPVQITDTVPTGTVIDWFTKQLTAFTLTGMAVANLRALESSAGGNRSLRCEIARVNSDGTSPTVWASWCIAPTGTDGGELTTSEVARTAYVSGDDLAFTDGQRIRIRVYQDDPSSVAMFAGGVTTDFFYAGTSAGASGDTYITLPVSLTEFSSSTPKTGTDTGAGADTTSALIGAIPVTEAPTGTDASVLVAVASVTDTGAGTDTASVSIAGTPKSDTDTGTGSDTGVRVATYADTDTGVGTDTGVRVATYVGTDAGVGADSATRVATYADVDSGVGTDTGVRVATYAGTDTGTGSETVAQSTAIATVDSGTGVDAAILTSASAASDSNALVTESGAYTSSYPVVDSSQTGADASALVAAIPTTDTGTGADSGSVAGPATFSGSDTGAGTDTSSLTAQVADTDTGTGADTGTRVAQYAVTDTGVGADDSAVNKPISDTGAGTDAGVRVATYAGVDAGTSTDTSVLVASYATTDTGVGSEASSLIAGNMLSGSDAGTGSETAVLTAQVPVVDTGAGADTSVLTAVLSATDTGAGTEASSLIAGNMLSGSDSGAGTETAALTSPVPVTDTGAGTDAAVVTAAYSGTDTGAGTDASTLSAGNNISVSDSGTGVDVVTRLVLTTVDGGTSTDSTLLVAVFSGIDTGAGTDTGSTTSLTSFTVSDVGVGADVLTARTATGSDIGSGSDTTAGRVLFVADVFIGADTSFLVARYTTADQGSGTESTSVNLGIPWVDTGGVIEMNDDHLPSKITVPPRTAGITIGDGVTKIGTPVSSASLSSDKPHATIK